MSKEHPPHHIPVLLHSVRELLAPQPGESYLDLTAGYGGHATAITEVTQAIKNSVLVDRDEYAISHLDRFSAQGARLLHLDFLAAARQLVEEGSRFDMILIDLGVSSPQLDQGERGFSFMRQGPLDMRMDRSRGRTAAELIEQSSAEELATIIRTYGEESPRVARDIAELLVSHRPFRETTELADLIKQHYRGRWSKIHPATRTFQALRIAVNDELGQVQAILPLLPRLLTKGGRVGIISFHSLEDRLVKQYFKSQQDAGLEAELQIVTKKPIDGATYDVHNPRSRSAKLRVAVKK